MKNTLKTIAVAITLVASLQTVAQEPKKPDNATANQLAKTSESMKAFTSMFDGKSESVAKALAKFGKAELDTKDMEMYGLINAKVITWEVTGTLTKYHIEVKSGATTRKYALVWENEKIIEIIDNGIKKPSLDDL
jgi:hypothetical protein